MAFSFPRAITKVKLLNVGDWSSYSNSTKRDMNRGNFSFACCFFFCKLTTVIANNFLSHYVGSAN